MFRSDSTRFSFAATLPAEIEFRGWTDDEKLATPPTKAFERTPTLAKSI
jgi:hypothetical protein